MNNRQQSGRRRGRGGQRPQGGQGRPEQGNRIDNRARGNAAQLLEKYKTLARDAQMQGDRVMTEYYLQFADHYFRVLSESRARFEESQPRRTRDDEDYDGDEVRNEADGDAESEGDEDYRREPRRNPVRQDRGERQERSDRDRNERHERPDRERGERRPRYEREEARERDERAPAEAEAEAVIEAKPERPAATRGLRPRRNGAANGRHHDAESEELAFDATLLPPAFNREPEPEPEAVIEEAPPAPKRRGRPKKVVEAPATEG